MHSVTDWSVEPAPWRFKDTPKEKQALIAKNSPKEKDIRGYEFFSCWSHLQSVSLNFFFVRLRFTKALQIQYSFPILFIQLLVCMYPCVFACVFTCVAVCMRRFPCSCIYADISDSSPALQTSLYFFTPCLFVTSFSDGTLTLLICNYFSTLVYM